ncbi:MAG: hypothetical protein Kow0088_02810 [Anaerolineales bacterium]
MRIIRASELSSFLYCHRAWWYQLQGIPPANEVALEDGRLAHQVHARNVRRAIWIIRSAYLLLLLAGLILLGDFIR